MSMWTYRVKTSYDFCFRTVSTCFEINFFFCKRLFCQMSTCCSFHFSLAKNGFTMKVMYEEYLYLIKKTWLYGYSSEETFFFINESSVISKLHILRVLLVVFLKYLVLQQRLNNFKELHNKDILFPTFMECKIE